MIYEVCARGVDLPNNFTGSALDAKKMLHAGLSTELCLWIDLVQKGIKVMHRDANDTLLLSTAQVVKELPPLTRRKLNDLEIKDELYAECLPRSKPVDATSLLLPEGLSRAVVKWGPSTALRT